MKRIKPTLLPAAGWFIISLILFTIPGSALPKESWLDKIWFDKWAHLGIFASLVVLCCWGWPRPRAVSDLKDPRKFFITLGIICLLYGVVVEFVQQSFIQNRSFDLGDIAADAAGCLLGVFYSIRYIKK